MRPLLCVRHQPSAGLGVAAGALERAGVEFRYLDAWRSEASVDPDDFSGLVVLGGEMNVDDFDRHPWLKGVRTITEQAMEGNVPVLGICLGAQTIARVLGATVGPSPVKEVGFHPVAHTPAGAVDTVVAPFKDVRVFQWHEDAFELPGGSALLCSGNEVPYQAFRYGNRIYGLQFHCEVDEQIIGAWCDETVDLEEGWGITKAEAVAEARRCVPAQRDATERAVRGFASLLER